MLWKFGMKIVIGGFYFMFVGMLEMVVDIMEQVRNFDLIFEECDCFFKIVVVDELLVD